MKQKFILALDVESLSRAQFCLQRLSPEVAFYKIGPVLFTAYGPRIVELVRKKGAQVFLDLKFHDIPNTVAGAVRQAVRLRVAMLTLHTVGGKEMLQVAAQAAAEEAKKNRIKKPLLLGVTVLTSDKAVKDTRATVVARARLARQAGLDGVVCSVHEAAAVRKACGRKFIIVTPGIRPAGAEAGDQKRVATAKTAFAAGANYIVVGRPILEAENPLRALKEIV
jgi:orotidine-5'-phosphate decarboxylase